MSHNRSPENTPKEAPNSKTPAGANQHAASTALADGLPQGSGTGGFSSTAPPRIRGGELTAGSTPPTIAVPGILAHHGTNGTGKKPQNVFSNDGSFLERLMHAKKVCACLRSSLGRSTC